MPHWIGLIEVIFSLIYNFTRYVNEVENWAPAGCKMQIEIIGKVAELWSIKFKFLAPISLKITPEDLFNKYLK